MFRCIQELSSRFLHKRAIRKGILRHPLQVEEITIKNGVSAQGNTLQCDPCERTKLDDSQSHHYTILSLDIYNMPNT